MFFLERFPSLVTKFIAFHALIMESDTSRLLEGSEDLTHAQASSMKVIKREIIC